MQRKTSFLFVLLAVALPITVFSLVNWYERNLQRLPVLSEDGNPVSDFQMMNQDGKIIKTNSWDGKIVVVNFFFTHCTSICPKMIVNLKGVQDAFLNEKKVVINSFTVDPERDTINRLSSYAQLFNIQSNNWNLLTGEKRMIYLLARKSFKVDATDGDGGPNDFIHSDKLILIDTQKRIRGYYDGTDKNQINQLIKDIRKLQKEVK